MIDQPARFAVGRRAYQRRCQTRPPTRHGRMSCEQSWQPFVAQVRQRLAQQRGPFPFTLEESADDDYTDGDMRLLGLLRVTVDGVWDHWQEWAEFDPPANTP